MSDLGGKKGYYISVVLHSFDYVDIPVQAMKLIHYASGKLWGWFNPFTPESDQSQISPPAPPELLHHTVRRTWLIIAYSDERWL